MRKLASKIIRILDGTPAEYGRMERGQSLIEVAFSLPILIGVLVGMVEIGWFANNYLILLEVTRVASRYGSTQVEDNSPLAWEMNAETRAATLPPPRNGSVEATNYRDCNNDTVVGFYKGVACLALDSMRPLVINEDDVSIKDDIIISVFSTNLVPDRDDLTTNPERTVYDSLALPYSGQGGQSVEFRNSAPKDQSGNPKYTAAQVMVTGRYPAGANECPGDRDPFDIDLGNDEDSFELDQQRRNIKLTGGTLFDGGTDSNQRGWAYTGKWDVPGTTCFGSAFGVTRMESVVNLNNTGHNAEQMKNLPERQAFVLVEVNWQHNLLLDFPGFSPVFGLLGGGQGSYVSVWAAFPSPASEFFLNLDPS